MSKYIQNFKVELNIEESHYLNNFLLFLVQPWQIMQLELKKKKKSLIILNSMYSKHNPYITHRMTTSLSKTDILLQEGSFFVK